MDSMFLRKPLSIAMICCFALVLGSCGSGGGGGGGSSHDSHSSDSGKMSVSVTDAKPVLPPGTEKVLITFDEVSVHKSTGVAGEGEWISLPMVHSPYTIDLLQFADGKTTSLVPPVKLENGRYTQIRIGVTSATIVINGEAYAVTIPSGNLKTDKEFDFMATGGSAINLTVDFDLGRSIVVTGSGTFKLKPVLHIVQTTEAATITGQISGAIFGIFTEATVIVTCDRDNSGGLTAGDEEYTRLSVSKGATDPTAFNVFWLVPNQSYLVQIEIGGVQVYIEALNSTVMTPGAIVSLNGGLPI